MDGILPINIVIYRDDRLISWGLSHIDEILRDILLNEKR